MARTHPKWIRAYVDGYDWSGVARKVGSLGVTYDSPLDNAFADTVKNTILGEGVLACGPLSAFFSPTYIASGAGAGFHDYFNSMPAALRQVLIAIGAGKAPAMGDPVFAWPMEQGEYKADPSGGFMAASMSLLSSGRRGFTNFSCPWGVLLHANAAETAVNSAAGVDDVGLVSTLLGGAFAWQLLASNGTVTLKAQDSADNATGWADITGLTSGAIDATTLPKSGMVTTAVGATLRRYLRWQLVFGSGSSATFVCAAARQQTS